MENEHADVRALKAALEAATAENSRLRGELDAAGGVIERLRDEAQAGSKAKADFMARMTHELRTPLSAIIGLANLAAPSLEDPHARDYLAKIIASAKGLLDVVDDITDFARLEKGQADLTPLPFDLAVSLDRVAGRFAPAAQTKGLPLHVQLDPQVPTRLVGDYARLEGVLGHLVGNAVKFTERGGVEIRVALVQRQADTVRLSFAVSDTGIGMDRDTIPAMLESFTQGDGSLSRPYGGTGLGLALVKRGATLLGGELAVTSQPGEGTRFAFEATFAEDLEYKPAPVLSSSVCTMGTPAPSAPAFAPLPAVGDKSSLPLAQALVLLVEDNAINQQVAREVLERFGAVVDVAGNGREAVEMAKVTFYDAVLMDVQMPVMDGLAATQAIRQLPGGGDLPIIALTAHALAEDRERCLAAGMNDYLTKPIDPGRLLASLGRWIASAAQAATVLPDAPPKPASATGDGETAVPPLPQPGLDAGQALSRLGGNERLFLNIAAEFVRDYATSAVSLMACLEAGDLDGARRLAHTVKGVAGNLSAEALAVAARELESVLGAGEVPAKAALDTYAEALAVAIEDASRLTATPDASEACLPGTSWRVLLVDDAKLNRAVLSQILRSAGHEVVTAVNGKEACRRLFGEKPSGRPFDCILMDIEMPEMDGPTATRIIRGLLRASANPPCSPDIPIVALTSHEPGSERENCLAAGMNDCLYKTYEHDVLLAALNRLMGGGTEKARRSVCPQPTAMTAAGLTPLLICLAGHLVEGNIRADEDVAVLREAFAGRNTPAEVEALSQAVGRYDFTGALAILNRLAPLVGVQASVLPTADAEPAAT